MLRSACLVWVCGFVMIGKLELMAGVDVAECVYVVWPHTVGLSTSPTCSRHVWSGGQR